MSEWQPIETAPRDGTQVFLFVPGFNHKVHVGFFLDTERLEYGVSVGKRQCWSVGSRDFMGSDPKPTLWMPIPAAPERESAA